MRRVFAGSLPVYYSTTTTTWILLPCVCNKHYESWFPRDPTPALQDLWQYAWEGKRAHQTAFPDIIQQPPSTTHPPTWFIVWSFRISFSHRRLVQSLEIFRQFYTTSLMSPLTQCKVHVILEGHKILRNIHLIFALCSASHRVR